MSTVKGSFSSDKAMVPSKLYEVKLVILDEI